MVTVCHQRNVSSIPKADYIRFLALALGRTVERLRRKKRASQKRCARRIHLSGFKKRGAAWWGTIERGRKLNYRLWELRAIVAGLAVEGEEGQELFETLLGFKQQLDAVREDEGESC